MRAPRGQHAALNSSKCFATCADWKDSKGRAFPGYPDARSPPYNKAKLNYAQCWDESAPPIFVRTIDICPCQRPPEQGGYNRMCCMTAPHFDLSYWAFEVCLRACACVDALVRR